MLRHTYTLALVVFGCGNHPSGPSVQVSLDGISRAVTIDGPIPLAKLVTPAPEAWLAVHAEAPGNRAMDIPAPARTYPHDELRLYVDHGRAAIGVFPPITDDMPAETRRLAAQPLASLVDVTTVAIQTKLPELPPLALELDGQTIQLATAQLRALPLDPDDPGWRMVDVLALAPRPPRQQIRVIGNGSATIDANLLHDAEHRVVLKVNNKGEYVFRVWDSSAKSPTREVRGVTKIEVQ